MLKINNILDQKSLIEAFYTSVNSILSYNVLLWVDSTEFKRVFIAQKRAVKVNI